MKNDVGFRVGGLVIMIGIIVCGVAYAATNIDTKNTGERWGWNDILGWIAMRENAPPAPIATTVLVFQNAVTGWASSLIGPIMFDCATTPSGNTCSAVNFQTMNDGAGQLSGWAWNDAVGWIWMRGTTADGQSYGVRIDPGGSGGNYFRGFAWNDFVGWINFNCLDNGSSGSCGTNLFDGNNYKTQTDSGLLPAQAIFVSNILDIGTTAGIFNTLTWKSALGSGGNVQFAVATATNPTALANPIYGPWFPVFPYPARPVPLTNNNVNTINTILGLGGVENRQYIRYKVSLTADAGQGPRIDDIFINWSP